MAKTGKDKARVSKIDTSKIMEELIPKINDLVANTIADVLEKAQRGNSNIADNKPKLNELGRPEIKADRKGAEVFATGLTKIEKNAIENVFNQNINASPENQIPLKELTKMIKKPVQVIEAYMKELAQNYGKKLGTARAKLANRTFGGKKGVTMMTEAAAQIADEARKTAKPGKYYRPSMFRPYGDDDDR